MGTPKGGDVGDTQGNHVGTQGRWLWGHPREVTMGAPKGAMGAPKGGDNGGTQGSHGGTQGR